MSEQVTIGAVSRETGVAIRTIRFYEAEGVLPPPSRTRSGYRVYSPNDVRRLRLVRNARLLGLGLPEIRALVDQAFASDCHSFAPQLGELIAKQRSEVSERIASLQTLRDELDELERHVMHAQCATEPGQLVSECGYCPLIDEEGDTCDEASGCSGSD
jgi:DNA-binding transcriptional MerR regulator